MKFGFIAKHRGIWPIGWLCEALGVSRSGFYAWLSRPPSRRARADEELSGKVRASFLASDRTYGARRVWHDLLAEGVICGRHRIERLMRLQTLRARPRRRRLPSDVGERQPTAIAQADSTLGPFRRQHISSCTNRELGEHRHAFRQSFSHGKPEAAIGAGDEARPSSENS